MEESNDELKKYIKIDIPFLIYFATMFCLYTNTNVQVIIQGFIIGYVLYTISKRPVINRERICTLSFYFLWYCAFSIFLFISKYWAYGIFEDSKTKITVFRILVIGFCMFLYVDSKERAISVLKSFIIAILIMGIAALVTTPIRNYGKTNAEVIEGGFGTRIGQHRNGIGAVSAAMLFISYNLFKKKQLKYGNLLAIFFGTITIISGSRSSILQILLIYFIMFLISKESFDKKIKKIIIGSFFFIIILVAMRYVPFLYNTIWVRIGNALDTLSGREINDTSTLGREFYKDIAYIMFKKKPLYGYGVDGFNCFLRDHPYIMGVYIKPVTAHCNYAEISADFGIIGLVIWYVPIIYLIIEMFKIKNKKQWMMTILSTFLSIIIFEYSRIPFDTHMYMYLYFIMVILCKFEIINYKKGAGYETENN